MSDYTREAFERDRFATAGPVQPPATPQETDENWHPTHRLGSLGCLDCMCGGGHADHAKPCPFNVASTPSPEGQTWQPIETAPKDGTRVLLFHIDAARAAEAAQHQQEIAAKDDELVMLRKGLKEACRQNVELRAERDRLKAALQDVVYTIAGWRTGSIGSIGNVHVGSFDVEHLARLRAALTPQGQSTDGETR